MLTGLSRNLQKLQWLPGSTRFTSNLIDYAQH